VRILFIFVADFGWIENFLSANSGYKLRTLVSLFWVLLVKNFQFGVLDQEVANNFFF